MEGSIQRILNPALPSKGSPIFFADPDKFFDVGVVASLQGREFTQGTTEFGAAFETLIMHELLCYRDYAEGDSVSFWRSDSGFEVDFIIGDHTAIEAKAKGNVSSADLRSLRALAEERAFKRNVCASLETHRRRVGDIVILPFAEFLEELWDGRYR